jgi:hypothetical protein
MTCLESRVYPSHGLIDKAKELGLNFICGNSHAMEIFENFRDRVTSTPLGKFGTSEIQDYAKDMAFNYLRKK